MIHKSKKIFTCGRPFFLFRLEFAKWFCFANSNPENIVYVFKMISVLFIQKDQTKTSRLDDVRSFFWENSWSANPKYIVLFVLTMTCSHHNSLSLNWFQLFLQEEISKTLSSWLYYHAFFLLFCKYRFQTIPNLVMCIV